MKNVYHLISVTAFVLCLAACNSNTYNGSLPKTFLIPADYKGNLRVVYEEKCGITPKAENGRQILEFMENGLLILNSAVDPGKENEYYLVDEKGKRTKVSAVASFKDSSIKPAIVVGNITVSSGDVNYENSTITHTSGMAVYVDYRLFNKDTLEVNEALSKRNDSVTNALVNACRANK